MISLFSFSLIFSKYLADIEEGILGFSFPSPLTKKASTAKIRYKARNLFEQSEFCEAAIFLLSATGWSLAEVFRPGRPFVVEQSAVPLVHYFGCQNSEHCKILNKKQTNQHITVI